MTELTWEGKFKDGKKVAPVRIALPFQTIETVNESSADRDKRLSSLFQQKEESEWRNRLIWGDKKYVLPSLLPEFAGKINLIYIDPPFDTGANFSFTATIPDHPDTDYDETTQFVKEPSVIEQKAYRDTWGRGLDSYMQWFYETIVLIHELLSQDGSIFVHLDWHVSHYAKSILDEVFGYENFINEIIWKRSDSHNDGNRMGIVDDRIFYYSKSSRRNFNKQHKEYSQEYLDNFYNKTDENGRKYRLDHFTKPKGSRGYFYNYKTAIPPPNGWRCPKETMSKFDESGLLIFAGDKVYKKRYLDEQFGNPLNTIWDDVSGQLGNQSLNYQTQKPEILIKRIIEMSTRSEDLILDCFSGSGTTAAVAEKLNRRWITCDLGRFAIHTTRKRLLGIENVKPFEVQNLGKYERQQWMKSEFDLTPNPSPNGEGNKIAMQKRLEQERAYKHFIVSLYNANILDGYTWLHGTKSGRMIHVGNVDAPVTVEDIKSAIKEFWKLVGKEKSIKVNGIDFLGWDFAFEVNETAKQFAAENKVNVSFKKIPREVLEKKAVEQGDIKFYELASLSIKKKIKKQDVEITLDNFIVPPDDIPEDVRKNISHWSQWVDYWAIDWNYKNDTFHNEWQSYRTKQNPKIELTSSHQYEEKGKYVILVKVIDILGNDTTKALEIIV